VTPSAGAEREGGLRLDSTDRPLKSRGRRIVRTEIDGHRESSTEVFLVAGGNQAEKKGVKWGRKVWHYMGKAVSSAREEAKEGGEQTR